jgi:hypothetical protein
MRGIFVCIDPAQADLTAVALQDLGILGRAKAYWVLSQSRAAARQSMLMNDKAVFS